MLDGTIPPEETKHYLGIVSQETGRLARLVQNMLDITKLEAGEVPIHAQTYDLWKTVTDVVLSDEQRIEDGKIDIQGLGGDPLLIYADPDFVHQVVYNIVDNAIKFTPAGGTISFAAERRGNMVEVRIENTGAGIAPEALPFVFERFYKEDRSRGMTPAAADWGCISARFWSTFPAARSTPRARKATGAGSCLRCRQGNKQPHNRRCTKAASVFLCVRKASPSGEAVSGPAR